MKKLVKVKSAKKKRGAARRGAARRGAARRGAARRGAARLEPNKFLRTLYVVSGIILFSTCVCTPMQCCL